MSKHSNKPLSKEALVERLRVIASDESYRTENNLGAMCYSVSAPFEMHRTCDICGRDYCYDSDEDHGTIIDLVDEMAELGYDVKVETVCRTCAEKIEEELYPVTKPKVDNEYVRRHMIFRIDIGLGGINHIFYFRTTADAEYHRAIANDSNQYKALLTLLQNEPMYGGSYDESHYIADEKDVLEFMTGIKFNV